MVKRLKLGAKPVFSVKVGFELTKEEAGSWYMEEAKDGFMYNHKKRKAEYCFLTNIDRVFVDGKIVRVPKPLTLEGFQNAVIDAMINAATAKPKAIDFTLAEKRAKNRVRMRRVRNDPKRKAAEQKRAREIARERYRTDPEYRAKRSKQRRGIGRENMRRIWAEQRNHAD